MDIDINLQEFYSKDQIEKIFKTNFGARIKGINLRIWDDKLPYIILFSRVDGPYSDNTSGDFFYYDGEGLDGDQKLTAANKALTNANADTRVIYGFRQEVAGENWRYLGILEVIDYDYVLKNGRKIYEFKLRQSNIEDTKVLDQEEQKMLRASSLPDPILIEDRKVTSTKTIKKIRDEAFRRKIKKMYNDTCVVCNKRRYTNSRYPEVQAAHIFPVEKNGSDDLRNGIALCRLHHWAFDGGLFSINDQLVVVVSSKILDDANYDEITKYNGQSIMLPSVEQYKPAAVFLKEHRLLHGFE